MDQSEPVRLLLVDDEATLREPLADYLVRQGFVVDQAGSAAEARTRLRDAPPDLVLLDIMMPGEDGLSLCRHLAESQAIPTILLTARGEATDRIVGLEIGADDYLPKPFNPRELLARIRAVLRRLENAGVSQDGERPRKLSFDHWEVDLAARELRDPDGTLVVLTSGEFDLLEALVERPQQVLSRDQLADLTSGRVLGPLDRSIDVALSRLRRKLGEDPKTPKLIKTVRHGGYYFASDVTSC